MDRSERRRRNERIIRRRKSLADAKLTKVKHLGKLRKNPPELYRCDCDGCSNSRQGKHK